MRKRRMLIFGVASKQSICWAIAQQLQALGAEVILCCHPDLQERVQSRLAAPAGITTVYGCDVDDPESVGNCFAQLAEHSPIHGVVHGIAFSDRNELRGKFLHTSRENFAQTMMVSCYSFIEVARNSLPLMQEGGSVLTLTFDASRRSYPHYNVMGAAKAALETSMCYLATELAESGIRVNAISASPEETISARGIRDFQYIGAFAEAQSPMGRRATVEEIAQTAAYLLSRASSGVTGQVQFVDCGSSITAMPPVRNAAKMASAMGAIADKVAETDES